MKTLCIILIRAYQYSLSPDHGIWNRIGGGPVCKFYPTCSQYAIKAITQYGAIYGAWLAARRICKCHPWSHGGIDDICY